MRRPLRTLAVAAAYALALLGGALGLALFDQLALAVLGVLGSDALWARVAAALSGLALVIAWIWLLYREAAGFERRVRRIWP